MSPTFKTWHQQILSLTDERNVFGKIWSKYVTNILSPIFFQILRAEYFNERLK